MKKIEHKEYVLVQTFPLTNRVNIVHRTFNFEEVRDKFSIENLANDYKSFGIRICLNGTLYVVGPHTGEIKDKSVIQDWRIHSKYEQLDKEDNDGHILVCDCSYPYYSNVVVESCYSNTKSAGDLPVTCLQNDHDREIHDCPNCGKNLW